MKREIKFRGISTDSGKIVCGDLIQYKSGRDIWTDDIGRVFINPETIGQFTGLKDKNGVEIYEGDIVNWDFDNTVDKGIIIYDDDVAAFLFKINNDQEPDRLNIQQYNFLKSQWINPYEVIGNIHQNPELL